jgi:phage-related protein
MKVSYYTTASGRRPVVEYIKELQKKEKAELIGALEMIEKYGFDAPRVTFRQIRGKLWEIKIERGLSHCVFYASVTSQEIVLLHAYQKKSQKAPNKEIELAERRMREIF